MTTYKPVLVHHGILGQKWGIRRYQNKDGTLTEAGKKRYDDRQQKINEHLKKEESSRRDASTYSNDLKKVKNGDKSLVDKIYYDNTGEMDPFLSKKESVVEYLKRMKEISETSASYHRNQAEILANTPINKMTRDDMVKVTSGINKATLALNAIGSVALATVFKKYGGMSIPEATRKAFGIGLLSQATTSGANAIIREHMVDKRENSKS